MRDYLGLNIEKEIEKEIEAGHYKDIGNLINKGWEETRNSSFKFWDLIYNNKESQALEYREANVMVRDRSISLYICHKNKLERAFSQTINCCFTELERKSLLTGTLILGCRIPDKDLVQKLVALDQTIVTHGNQQALEEATKKGSIDLIKFLCLKGCDPNANKDKALKIAIEQGHTDLIKYFLKTSSFKDINYAFLDSTMSKTGKTKSFVTLLNSGVYLEGNNNQLLQSIDIAIKQARPTKHKEEIKTILASYPIKSLKDMSKQTDYRLQSLAIGELNRRKSVELGAGIQTVFKKELLLEF